MWSFTSTTFVCFYDLVRLDTKTEFYCFLNIVLVINMWVFLCLKKSLWAFWFTKDLLLNSICPFSRCLLATIARILVNSQSIHLLVNILGRIYMWDGNWSVWGFFFFFKHFLQIWYGLLLILILQMPFRFTSFYTSGEKIFAQEL